MLTRKWLHKQWHTWACLWPSHKQSISIGSTKPDRTSTAQEPLCTSLTLLEAAAPAVHPRKQVIYMDDRSWTSTSVDTLAQTMSAWHTFGGICGLKESTDKTQIAYYTQQHLDCCSNTHILLTCHKPLLPLPVFLAPAPQGKGHAARAKKKQHGFKQQKHFAPRLNSCLQIIKQRSKQQEYWQSAELVGWPSPTRNANSSKLTRRSAMSVVLSWGQQSLCITCFLVVLRSLRWSLV